MLKLTDDEKFHWGDMKKPHFAQRVREVQASRKRLWEKLQESRGETAKSFKLKK